MLEKDESLAKNENNFVYENKHVFERLPFVVKKKREKESLFISREITFFSKQESDFSNALFVFLLRERVLSFSKRGSVVNTWRFVFSRRRKGCFFSRLFSIVKKGRSFFWKSESTVKTSKLSLTPKERVVASVASP